MEEECVLCVEGGGKGWKEGKEQKESRERREGGRVEGGQATARQPGRVARLQQCWGSELTKKWFLPRTMVNTADKVLVPTRSRHCRFSLPSWPYSSMKEVNTLSRPLLSL